MQAQTENYESLIVYSVEAAQIAELQAKFMGLKVANVNDKASYELCKKSRSEVRGYRLSIEEERKRLKAQSLDFGRKVDARAKELMEPLEEIEAHLKAQEAIIDNEKKRQEAEALRKYTERRNLRAAQLQQYQIGFSYDEIADMPDADFEKLVAEGKAAFEEQEALKAAQAKRLAKLEAIEKAQAEKLREQEREAQKLREQEREAQKLRDELLAKQRQELAEKEAEIAAQRAVAAEFERKANEERIAREREAVELKRAEERRAAEEAEAKRKAEAEAAKKVKDKKLLEEIKADFPTLESAWVEIARLKKLLEG